MHHNTRLSLPSQIIGGAQPQSEMGLGFNFSEIIIFERCSIGICYEHLSSTFVDSEFLRTLMVRFVCSKQVLVL